MSERSTSAGVFTTDAALLIRSWDEWLADVTGLAEIDARGRFLGDLFPELEARGLLGKLQRVATAGTVEVIAPAFHEFFFLCRPRVPSAHFEHMQQHAIVSPLYADEAIVGITVSVHDVTARREREHELAAQLASEDEAVRLRAVGALVAEEDGIAPLAAALADPSWRVRRAAAEGLASLRDASAVHALITTLRERHRDPTALNAALAALAHAESDVLPAVMELLESPESDADVRIYAALALGLIGSRGAVRTLLLRIDDDDVNVRFHVIEALGRIGAREAALPLTVVAESRDFTVAFAALDALASIGEPSVADRVVPLLDDRLLQTAAADALARIGSVDVTGPLVALLCRADGSLPDVALALATLYDRLDGDDVGRKIVAELAHAALVPDVEQAIIAALPDANTAEAEAFALVLGWRRSETADAGLISLLTRPGLQRIAANILVSRGVHAAAPMIDALASGDDETRKAAAAALGKIGGHAAAAPLAELLDGPAEVAIVAAGALGSTGDADAFRPLLRHVGHPHPAVRQAVVGALSSIGHPAMPTEIRELLKASSPRIRESAAKIAGYFGYADCFEDMLLLCTDPDDTVRRVALEQLPNFDDPRVIATITSALTTGNAGIRAASARALERVSAADAQRCLLHACEDADPWVRYYAARSLGRRDDGTPESALRALATTDQVLPVRIAAIEALGSLGGPEAADTLCALSADRDPSVASAALTALMNVAGGQVLPTLLAALQTDEPECHRAALVTIGHRGDPEAVTAVARLARTGTHSAIRELAVKALGEIGTESAIDALVELTADPRRSAASVSILAHVAEALVPSIGARLGHPDIEVRCALADALARTGSRLAVPFLAGALHDAAPSVQSAAASALRRIDVRDAQAPYVDSLAVSSSTARFATFARPS